MGWISQKKMLSSNLSKWIPKLAYTGRSICFMLVSLTQIQQEISLCWIVGEILYVDFICYPVPGQDIIK